MEMGIKCEFNAMKCQLYVKNIVKAFIVYP